MRWGVLLLGAISTLALLTSLYYSVHGLTGNDDRLPEWRTTLAEWLKAQGFATWGFVDGGYLRGIFGFAQGFDHYDDRPLHLASILDNVTAWLDQHPAKRFFLFVHCYDVHSPYAPPAPYDTLFDDADYRATSSRAATTCRRSGAGRRPSLPKTCGT